MLASVGRVLPVARDPSLRLGRAGFAWSSGAQFQRQVGFNMHGFSGSCFPQRPNRNPHGIEVGLLSVFNHSSDPSWCQNYQVLFEHQPRVHCRQLALVLTALPVAVDA